mgnify:CR=1 FL=1
MRPGTLAANGGTANPNGFALQNIADNGGSGLFIIAGAMNANRTIASFSDRAGTTEAANHYLTALGVGACVAICGAIGFVGLVAPHTARALVGGRHGRVVPVAMLLGAVLVSIADTVGRTVIAPAQIPAGLVTAMVGTPYFVWLLWRSRARA